MPIPMRLELRLSPGEGGGGLRKSCKLTPLRLRSLRLPLLSTFFPGARARGETSNRHLTPFLGKKNRNLIRSNRFSKTAAINEDLIASEHARGVCFYRCWIHVQPRGSGHNIKADAPKHTAICYCKLSNKIHHRRHYSGIVYYYIPNNSGKILQFFFAEFQFLVNSYDFAYEK